MSTRVFRLGVVVVFTLVAVALFGAVMVVAAPTQHVDVGNTLHQSGNEVGVDIHARRAISIPFGIDSPLALSADGRTVEVTGPGSCSEEGWFRIRVQVTQESTGAQAIGTHTGDCPRPADWTWSVTADTQGSRTFVEGSAEVCAHAITKFEREGAVVRQWCNDDVELVADD